MKVLMGLPTVFISVFLLPITVTDIKWVLYKYLLMGAMKIYI